ncbi:MAG: SgcJ/EcaC family oxidoreductase [Pirellulales bacterium]|nr:SgcJ/EcaC family oxidoreductase [Pirellulales bacterium]
MKQHRLLILLCLSIIAGCQATAQENADATNSPEDEIRASVAKYVDAFNNQDAEALADLWSEDGVFVDRDSGERIQGREALAEQFAATLSDDDPEMLSVEVNNIRFIADNVAIEEGVATIVRAGELPSRTQYEAVHVKEDGEWKIDSVREKHLEAPSSHYEHLRDLEWMIGEWTDQGEDDSVRLVCEWTKNRNFMTRSFAVSLQGKIDLEGTQVIGYDAADETVRYWLFDSDGGFVEGTWRRDDEEPDTWHIEGRGVLADGSRGSMVNVMKRVDDDTFTWETVSRQIGDEIMPNIEPVTIVRATK